MIPASFEYHAPRSIGEALSLLSRLGTESKLLAGGHSLLPMMKLRFAQPAHLIDLNRIPDLRGIREEGAELVVGAMTTEAELIGSPLVRNKVPLLAEGAGSIADPQVRYKGTIGGDISHGDPGNDHPALMLALEQERVYLRPGLSIGGLAKQLAIPEYRLRALINKRLGYRNFNALLHEYRLRDACAWLADPTKAHLPILTIALDVGYQSVAPFNQAFREATGCTPSAYRRQHAKPS